MKNKNQFRKRLFQLVILLLSLILSCFIAEGICRIIYNPVDYLMPYCITDPILGKRILPNSAGHDSWGFRNKTIPSKADIVTIGDSQTYGVSAIMKYSWPSILQNLTSKIVYNISLGGYGPVEYYFLLEKKAFLLNPSIVIVGFYYGNDLSDAYSIIYENKNWNMLQSLDFYTKYSYKNDDQTTDTGGEESKWIYDNWFSHHSVLFRFIYFSPIGDILRSMESGLKSSHDTIIVFKNEQSTVRTVLTPLLRFNAMDLNDARIQEGLRISLELFNKMNDFCLLKNIKFLVVLIPTKESVYFSLDKNNLFLNETILNKLIINEGSVNDLVKAYFNQHQIMYLDILPSLQKVAEKVQIYPSNTNGHPNRYGYQIIASSIGEYLYFHHLLE